MIQKILLPLFLVLVFLNSCKKSKLHSPEAAFMVIGNLQLQTTPSTQGNNTHKITDIWYYVDDNYQGALPLGNIMPVVGAGTHKINLFAGIKNNGISATRVPYDYYDSYTFTQNFEAGTTYTINPIFKYVTYAVFPLQALEDFEVSFSGYKYQTVGANPFYVISDPAKVYGGTGKSMYFTMTDANPDAKFKTTTSMSLPLGGTMVYLEINYKCNQPFQVGVIAGGTEDRGAITINASDTWNKIYVKLTDVVSTPPTFGYYDVLIRATKSVTAPEIYIDNIKLVTR